MRRVWVRLVVCAVALGAAGTGWAQGTPQTPSLSAALTKTGAVAVKWTWTADGRRSDAVLEIEASHVGKAAAPLAVVARPRRRGTFTVKDETAGTVTYRARLVLDGTPSSWSPGATVTVPGDPTSPPVPPDPPTPPTAGQACPGDVAGQVLALVNDARAAAGLSPLHAQSQLAAAAADRATTLASTGVLSHTGWIQAIHATGYAKGMIGENIAYGYASARSVFDAWMNSAAHRANILGQFYADMGLACRVDTRGTWWWSQEFGG